MSAKNLDVDELTGTVVCRSSSSGCPERSRSSSGDPGGSVALTDRAVVVRVAR